MSNEKLNVTKRNTKRNATKRAAVAAVAVATTSKRASKRTSKQQSAAEIMRALGVANTASEMKSARALLRHHSVERTTKAISAFFAKRKLAAKA